MEQTCETCGGFKDCSIFKNVWYCGNQTCDNWKRINWLTMIKDCNKINIEVI